MRIAIVILNWNGTKLLGQFLPSIVKYSDGAEIYVADNGSTDDSISFVKQNFPTVKIIANNANLGFAEGYNKALAHVDADILALVNSDIEVTEGWLHPIISAFAENSITAIIQPKIKSFNDRNAFEYAGAAGGYIDKYGFPFCRGRIFDTIETDMGQYDDDASIFWASGACLFIRSEVYRTLNGFDGDFFAHQEEIDLCWRAFNKGYEIKYVGRSTVYHVGGATLAQGNPQKTYLNFRNSLLMLVKNLPKSQLVKIIFLRMLLDGVAGVKFLISGKFKHTFAIIRAHMAFYKLMKSKYLMRGKMQRSNYYKLPSIVKMYFINGKKTYSKLF